MRDYLGKAQFWPSISMRAARSAKLRGSTHIERVGFSACLILALSAAQAWAQPFAYITNRDSNDVSVIDTATNTVVGAPIPVGTSPRGIAINSAGTRVYVANPGSNNVSVIDAATNTVVGTPIAVGSAPGALGKFIGPAPPAPPPYFVRLDVPPAAPPDCNADSVVFSSGANFSFNLPYPPGNLVILADINGVHQPGYPGIQDLEPIAGTLVGVTLNISPLGSPATPYTVVLQIFPATNGDPVGTGLQIRVQCNTLGARQGVATFSVVQPPSAAGIPATSTRGLTAMALLLVGAAMWQLRRGRA